MKFKKDTKLSIQDSINCNNGKIDINKMNDYIDGLIQTGWNELPLQKKYFNLLKPGMHIKFIHNDKFRSGGFISKAEVGDNGLFYISIVCYGKEEGFSVQLEAWINDGSLQHVYFKPLKKKKEQEPDVILFKAPTDETNFPVYLKNKNEKEILVYFARDNYDKKKFLNTRKYKKALETKNWNFY
jgi:hypothetical protein